jgi:hypothetical protein
MREQDTMLVELEPMAIRRGIKAHQAFEATLGQMLAHNGLLLQNLPDLARIDLLLLLLLVLHDMGNSRHRKPLQIQQMKVPKLGRRHMKHGRV